MSLILEALKKSEAQRQLGRAPGLMSPMLRVAKRRAPNPWWGVLGLALLIVGGAAWWVNREPAAVAVTSPGTASAPSAPAPIVVSAPTIAAQTPPPETIEAMPAPGQAPLPSDPDFRSVERESMPVAAASAPQRPRYEPEPLSSADVVSTAPTPIPATVLPIPSTPAPTAILPTADPPTLEAPDTLPTGSSTPPPVAAEASPETLPSVVDLMPDLRSALPALKLSMHVYAMDPADRFVLIDGKRFVQGDAISPSLTVSEIRRDGAVLDYGGKRFLVPRP